MKKTVILAVTLLVAAMFALGSSGVYITEINYATGRFKLSDYTMWGALNKRDIKDWKARDGITRVHSASCGSDPNVYLLTDVDESESACVLPIGR